MALARLETEVRAALESTVVGASAVETFVRLAWPHRKATIAQAGPTSTAPDPVLLAEVNHGRWIVRCPYCSGAAFASGTDPRFFCTECLHQGTARERRWLRVAWPIDPAAVDAVLELRPDPATRNFDPRRESVEDLLRENEAHGIRRA